MHIYIYIYIYIARPNAEGRTEFQSGRYHYGELIYKYIYKYIYIYIYNYIYIDI